MLFQVSAEFKSWKKIERGKTTFARFGVLHRLLIVI